jgi:outer membrane protein assembly factor BamD (BamD/ComL family)
LGKRTRITKKGLKHDALLETTAKGTKFIEDHLNKVLIGLAVVVVVIVVIAMVVRGQRATELAASADLMTAAQSANQGLLAQAAQEYQAVIDLYPGTRSAGAATCYLGTLQFQQQQYDPALENFQAYLDRYGSSGTLGKVALEGKASVLEQRRDFAGAAEIYKDLAAQARDLESTEARYLADAMRCYRSANDWEAVRETASDIVDNHPDTQWAADARTNLAEAEIYLNS